jgi:hypothetical protein
MMCLLFSRVARRSMATLLACAVQTGAGFGAMQPDTAPVCSCSVAHEHGVARRHPHYADVVSAAALTRGLPCVLLRQLQVLHVRSRQSEVEEPPAFLHLPDRRHD